ncbi:MAG: helix-turn-helix domain-containing protein [Candidatus Gallimonas sp.]
MIPYFCVTYVKFWLNLYFCQLLRRKNLQNPLRSFIIRGMKIFSERLMQLRKERGLSQATVAKDLGVSLGIVCYWETNKSDPTATNVAKLARYFNVTSDYLLGLSD